MEIYTQIQSKGLVTIPAKIRRNLDIQPSDLVKISERDGRIILEPVRVLSYPTRKYTAAEVNEFLSLDKDEA